MVQILGCDETFVKKVDQLFLNWHFFAVIHNFLEGLAWRDIRVLLNFTKVGYA